MWSLLVSTLVFAAPSWSTLSPDAGWASLGSRSTSVGPVSVRRQFIDGVTCLEGRLIATVRPSQLLAVADDMVSAARWSSAGLAYSEELSRSEGRYVLFQYFDVPDWTLVSDRYWVLEGTVSEGRYRFRRLRADAYPEIQLRVAVRSRSAIEPPVNFGEWTFTPTPKGTQIRYANCADFGGAIPAGVQRWVSTQQLPAMMADFVTEASQR